MSCAINIQSILKIVSRLQLEQCIARVHGTLKGDTTDESASSIVITGGCAFLFEHVYDRRNDLIYEQEKRVNVKARYASASQAYSVQVSIHSYHPDRASSYFTTPDIVLSCSFSL